MKTSLWPLLVFLFPQVSSLQAAPEDVIGGVSTVALALKLTTTVEGTVAKDPTTGKALPKSHPDAGPAYDNTWVVKKKDKKVEEIKELVSKQISSKYSNKELLQDLVTIGVIDGIKGWSLVKVQATIQDTPEMQAHDLFQERAGPVRFYLTHKDKAPIGLDNILGTVLDFQSGISQKIVGKKVTKFDASENPTTSAITYATTFKSVSVFYLYLIKPSENDNEEEELEKGKILYLTGLYSGGEKVATFGPEKKLVMLSTPGKIASAYGMYMTADESAGEFTEGLLEGSVSFGAAVAKELNTFPRVTDPVDVPGGG